MNDSNESEGSEGSAINLSDLPEQLMERVNAFDDGQLVFVASPAPSADPEPESLGLLNMVKRFAEGLDRIEEEASLLERSHTAANNPLLAPGQLSAPLKDLANLIVMTDTRESSKLPLPEGPAESRPSASSRAPLDPLLLRSKFYKKPPKLSKSRSSADYYSYPRPSSVRAAAPKVSTTFSRSFVLPSDAPARRPAVNSSKPNPLDSKANARIRREPSASPSKTSANFDQLSNFLKAKKVSSHTLRCPSVEKKSSMSTGFTLFQLDRNKSKIPKPQSDSLVLPRDKANELSANRPSKTKPLGRSTILISSEQPPSSLHSSRAKAKVSTAPTLMPRIKVSKPKTLAPPRPRSPEKGARFSVKDLLAVPSAANLRVSSYRLKKSADKSNRSFQKRSNPSLLVSGEIALMMSENVRIYEKALKLM